MKLKIIILLTYTLIVALVIHATPANQALLHDAGSYYQQASSSLKSTFIDPGYPFILGLIMSAIGKDNILWLQIVNYIFWITASWFIYKSLTHLNSKHAKFTSLIMLFSPLFLTFSAKLYSEPFAALGVSLMLYGVVSSATLPLILGAIVLGTTKSIFVPGIIFLALYFFINRNYSRFIPLCISLLILLPTLLGSLGGGRSIYNLNIQASKLDESYDQIIACAPYYLSYPIGKTLLPNYEGVCHQNDVSVDMPGYNSNPYVIAEGKRSLNYSLVDWIKPIIHNPIKYITIITISLFNIALFEGIYPSIILQLPLSAMLIGYLICKLLLSVYLWLKVIKISRVKWILLFPLVYFVFVVGNFPIEPRYFYPLIPYIYFLSGLDHNTLNKI